MGSLDFQALGPAFTAYVRPFLDCCPHKNTRTHFTIYCLGLLRGDGRKSVEPIALAGGPAVRTLQVFLAKRPWDEQQALATLQRRLAATVKALPDDGLGTIGVLDETSCRKWGDQTPGVQRQYLGCEGKIENGIVTVHVGVAKGTFTALCDADLYLPNNWAEDRDRCRAAGIPDDVVFRAKWRIAFDQLLRLKANGHAFDWLTFDEGYGGKPKFLTLLDLIGQRYVGEVPSSFAVKTRGAERSRQVRTLLSRSAMVRGVTVRVTHATVADTIWRAVERHSEVNGYPVRIIAAICESTGEVKYFVSNDRTTSLGKLLRVAFRRWTIEHGFRLAKQEAGLMHFEGRHYRGLLRHLTLSLIVLGFVAEATESLRGEKPSGDSGAGVPEVEPLVCRPAAAADGSARAGSGRLCDRLSSAA